MKVWEKPCLLYLWFVLVALIGLVVTSCGGSGRGKPEGPPGQVVVPPPLPEGALDVPPHPSATPPSLADEPGEFAAVVVSREGEPVADYEIVVDGEPIVAKTDEEGVFFIPDLPPGSHLIELVRDGVSIASFPVEVSGEPENTTLVSNLCEIGEPEGIDRSDPRFFEVHRFTGRVMDQEGSPLAGAEVVLFDQRGFFQRAFTDQQGNYKMVGDIRSDTLMLGAFMAGYLPEVREVSVITEEIQHDFMLTRLAQGEVAGELSFAGQFRGGRVRFIARLSEEETLPNLEEELSADGTFSLTVPSGLGVLEALVETDQGTLGASLPVTVGEGQTVQFSLALGPVAVGELRGVVVDGAGQPVAGALVELLRGEEVVATVQSGADGTFVIPEPPAGVFLLRVSAGGQEVMRPVVVRARLNPLITLNLAGGSALALIHGAVNVVEGGGVRPGVNVVVQVRSLAGQVLSVAQTGADGGYQVFLPVGAGQPDQVEVVAFMPGFRSQAQVVELGEAAISEVSFLLEPERIFPPMPRDGTVSGVVRDAIGTLPSAQVSLFARRKPGGLFDVVAETLAGEGGTFRFSQVPTGRELLIRVRSLFHQTLLTTLRLAPGESRELELTLSFGTPATTPVVEVEVFRVTEQGNQKVVGATVRVMDLERNQLAQGETNQLGIARLPVEGLPELFLVEVSGPGLPTLIKRGEFNPLLPELPVLVRFPLAP